MLRARLCRRSDWLGVKMKNVTQLYSCAEASDAEKRKPLTLQIILVRKSDFEPVLQIRMRAAKH
jgi:hypothetical protein